LNYGVIPSSSSNQGVNWSSSDETIATVTPGGFVLGVGSGTVTISATAKDGGPAVGTIDFDVRGLSDKADGFDTYNYGSYIGTWMIENSTLGTSSAETYNDGQYSGLGYYYTWDQAQAGDVCPTGFSLPNVDQWSLLRDFINGSSANAAEKAPWVSSAALAGSSSNGTDWYSWGTVGNWWSSSATGQNFYGSASASHMTGPRSDPAGWFSVRCIKD
jgi:uncharacterized protein (TIGR02145 family)